LPGVGVVGGSREAGEVSLPGAPSPASAGLLAEVAPDGPDGELPLPGKEAGHLFGLQNPDTLEGREML